MYRVLLIDDERLIRRSIRNRVNWERLRLEVAGEAQNGAEALELLETIRPHIALVDIRMPLMDGLAFITEAKKRHPEIRYIVSSAYSDFEYAKQAIQLNVADYILKPVNVSEIENILEKLVHELEEEKLIKQLKRGSISLEDQPSGVPKRLLAAAFYLPDDESKETILGRRLQDALQDCGAAEIFSLKEYSCGDCYVFLIHSDSLNRDSLQNTVEQVLEQLENPKGYAAWSDEAVSKDPAHTAERAVKILKRKLFYPERRVLSEYHMTVGIGTEKQTAGSGQNRIRESMNAVYQYQIKNDIRMMRRELQQLPEWIVEKSNSVKMIETALMELEVLLRRMLGELTDETEYEILFHGIHGKDYLLRYQTGQELVEVLRDMIDRVMKRCSASEEVETIDRIKDYIRRNFAENLNAADIASQFFLNSSYLSVMFKEKTGMNMSAYIEAVRMEKAKQLLQEGSFSVTEIAMRTGYSESNYFSKVFKKYTGMSPKQFREAENKRQN